MRRKELLKRYSALGLSALLSVQCVFAGAAEIAVDQEVPVADNMIESTIPLADTADGVFSDDIPSEEVFAKDTVFGDVIAEDTVVSDEIASDVTTADNLIIETSASDNITADDASAENVSADNDDTVVNTGDVTDNDATGDNNAGVAAGNATADDVTAGVSTETSIIYAAIPETPKADIQNLTIGDVETNNKYQFLSFIFKGEDETLYEGFITGLEGLKDTLDDVKATVQDIADAFLSRFIIPTMKPINDLESIDAEKYYLEVEPADPLTEGYPWGDSELCWAATNSNMLEFTGWGDAFKDEDEIFTQYTNSFFNQGGHIADGLRWFLNGIYTEQHVDAGECIYPDYLDIEYADGTQQRTPGTGGYAEDYFASDVIRTITSTDIKDDVSPITDGLKAGNGIGLSYIAIDKETPNDIMISHAITLFGYIKEVADNTLNGLKAFVYADSDNNKGNPDQLIHPNAQDTESVRRKKPNTLCMEYLYYSDDDPRMNMIAPNDILDMYINRMDILDAKASVSDDLIETKGTKDATQNLDMIITSVKSVYMDSTTYYEGDDIAFSIETQNLSYAHVAREEVPTISFTCSIYKDGEFYDQVKYEDEMLTLPFQSALSVFDELLFVEYISFNEAGTYSIKVAIDEIKDKDGNILPEAYTINNTYDTELVFTIIKKSEPIPAPDPQPIPDPDKKPDKKPDSKPNQKPVQDTITELTPNVSFAKCLCEQFNLECMCKDCTWTLLDPNWMSHVIEKQKISYKMRPSAEPDMTKKPLTIKLPIKKQEVLNIFLDGKHLCKDLYKIKSYKKDHVKIIINDRIPEKAGSGEHELVIQTEQGYIRCIVNIINFND